MDDVGSKTCLVRYQKKPDWRWYLGLSTPLYRLANAHLWGLLYWAAVLYVGWLESGWTVEGGIEFLHIGGFGFWCLAVLGVVLILQPVWYRQWIMNSHVNSAAECVWFVRASEDGLSIGLEGVEEVRYSWNMLTGVKDDADAIRCFMGRQQLVIRKPGELAEQMDAFSGCLRAFASGSVVGERKDNKAEL